MNGLKRVMPFVFVRFFSVTESTNFMLRIESEIIKIYMKSIISFMF